MNHPNACVNEWMPHFVNYRWENVTHKNNAWEKVIKEPCEGSVAVVHEKNGSVRQFVCKDIILCSPYVIETLHKNWDLVRMEFFKIMTFHCVS